MALASDRASIEYRLSKAGRTVPPGACAVVLPGGDAYLFGGQTAAGLTNSVERIDESGSSRPLAPMPSPLAGHSCTALPGGQILVAGGAVHGFVTAALEIYDPAEDRWRSQGTLAVPRARHTATALADGSVVFTGGETPDGPTATVEVYSAATERSRLTGAVLHDGRYGHRGELQGDGTVLLEGGSPDIPEIFDPVSNKVTQSTGVTATRRVIRFSGHDWWVKASAGSRVGPGPNLFSDSTNNVWVDSAGRLHLRLTPSGNTWQCAEVVSNASFGHGTYRFYLDTPVDNFDPNVVVGLFTWKTGDPAYYYREIDIEFSKWGNARSGYNADYAVQPYTTPGQSLDFYIPAGLSKTNHSFLWTPTLVTARSVIGESATPANPSQIIREHTFRSGIPPAGGENVRMNLWLFQGRAPRTKSSIEVIVNRFEFIPLAP